MGWGCIRDAVAVGRDSGLTNRMLAVRRIFTRDVLGGIAALPYLSNVFEHFRPSPLPQSSPHFISLLVCETYSQLSALVSRPFLLQLFLSSFYLPPCNVAEVAAPSRANAQFISSDYQHGMHFVFIKCFGVLVSVMSSYASLDPISNTTLAYSRQNFQKEKGEPLANKIKIKGETTGAKRNGSVLNTLTLRTAFFHFYFFCFSFSRPFVSSFFNFIFIFLSSEYGLSSDQPSPRHPRG